MADRPEVTPPAFDFVIVGAGSAGCTLANRLTASGKYRVLLLEAGGQDDWVWFKIPVGYLYAMGNPRADWCYSTEPVPGLGGSSPRVSAREGDWWIIDNQRHDLYAQPGGRLRSLAPAR